MSYTKASGRAVSITARDWALRQELAPVHKFVLVVLADAADDQGVCWPRISTVADKVGVSTRTVQRAIQHLARQKLISVEPVAIGRLELLEPVPAEA